MLKAAPLDSFLKILFWVLAQSLLAVIACKLAPYLWNTRRPR